MRGWNSVVNISVHITCLKWVTLCRCNVRWCSSTDKRTTSNWTAASTGRSILWHRQHIATFDDRNVSFVCVSTYVYVYVCAGGCACAYVDLKRSVIGSGQCLFFDGSMLSVLRITKTIRNVWALLDWTSDGICPIDQKYIPIFFAGNAAAISVLENCWCAQLLAGYRLHQIRTRSVMEM